MRSIRSSGRGDTNCLKGPEKHCSLNFLSTQLTQNWAVYTECPFETLLGMRQEKPLMVPCCVPLIGAFPVWKEEDRGLESRFQRAMMLVRERIARSNVRSDMPTVVSLSRDIRGDNSRRESSLEGRPLVHLKVLKYIHEKARLLCMTSMSYSLLRVILNRRHPLHAHEHLFHPSLPVIRAQTGGFLGFGNGVCGIAKLFQAASEQD